MFEDNHGRGSIVDLPGAPANAICHASTAAGINSPHVAAPSTKESGGSVSW
ncbi:MAG: hypothetical protein R3A10_11665 [Caldilineaceae bacterium]